jgi:hypothetical protein
MASTTADLRAKMSPEEHTLREMLWLSHAFRKHILYGDDGEMQCNTCRIDFLRMSPDEIKDIIVRNNMKRYVRMSTSEIKDIIVRKHMEEQKP